MDIQMIGIDHSKASIDFREAINFTKHEAELAMRQIMDEYNENITGCILFSTCNRTELYISYSEEEVDAYGILCKLKNIDSSVYEGLFTIRTKDEVVSHLFSLACGLKSKVFGEDQIITQVKEALVNAREAEATDIVLEKLFLMAVTAAKRVKSSVHLTAVNTSVVENMLIVLKQRFNSLCNLHCFVIGNGEIRKLAATRLINEGAKVTMTIRQYKSKEVDLPCDVTGIDYQERYDILADMDVIVSATASPHHTIRFEEAYELLNDGKGRVLIDMAVPRDISMRLSVLDNLELYNIDRLGGIATDEINNQAVAIANKILLEYENEYRSWYHFREYIPLIQGVGRTSAVSVVKRIDKQMKKLIEDEEKIDEIQKLIKTASNKVVTNLLYGLKDNLKEAQWQSCLDAIENASRKNESEM